MKDWKSKISERYRRRNGYQFLHMKDDQWFGKTKIECERAMETICTIQLSLFLMASLMMISFMTCLMTFLRISLRAVLDGHDGNIGKKDPYDDQNPNPFFEHFLLFPFLKEGRALD